MEANISHSACVRPNTFSSEMGGGGDLFLGVFEEGRQRLEEFGL